MPKLYDLQGRPLSWRFIRLWLAVREEREAYMEMLRNETYARWLSKQG